MGNHVIHITGAAGTLGGSFCTSFESALPHHTFEIADINAVKLGEVSGNCYPRMIDLQKSAE